MGKGGRWLGTRTLLPAWDWLHPKQARQEARVPGIQSAPQKSNMGWRHQLLHALSRVWKNKTQTWPQGDALLACIPTTCVSTGKGQQGNGDRHRNQATQCGAACGQQIWFPSALFSYRKWQKGKYPAPGMWELQVCGVLGRGGRISALLANPKQSQTLAMHSQL